MPWGALGRKVSSIRGRPVGQVVETPQVSCCCAPSLPPGACVKRYGPRSTLNDDDYDKVLSAGEAPANVSAYKTGSRASHPESPRIT